MTPRTKGYADSYPLRLPPGLKSQCMERAAVAGQSANEWMIRRLSNNPANTDTARKISALEWGIHALEIELQQSVDISSRFVQLIRKEGQEKINVLTKIKAELEAKA